MERERVEPAQPLDLIEKAKLGDREAFGELVALYQNEVFTLAVRLVRDRELAADVSQDAFIRAWRAMPKFRGDAKFSTWLHRITVNTAWTHRARENRVRLDPLDAIVTEPRAATLDPVRAGEAASAAPKIEEALMEQQRQMRASCVRKDVHGGPPPETSDNPSISVTAAQVRLHRGRKALRRLLDGYQDGAS